MPIPYLLVALLMTALLGPGCSNLGMYSASNDSGEASNEPADSENDDSQGEDETGDDDDSAANDQSDPIGDDDSADDDTGDDETGDDDTGDDDTAGDDTVGDDDSADDDTASADDCSDSPVVGMWSGAFDGAVNYAATPAFLPIPISGAEDVSGNLSFTITCTDRLAISGTMAGTDDSGSTFSAELEGDYDATTDQLNADINNGSIELELDLGAGALPYSIVFEGDFDGTLAAASSPLTIDGTWQLVAPMQSIMGVADLDGTGSGTWSAELQP